MKHFKPGPSTIGMFALATAAGLGIGGVSAAMNEPSLIVSQKGRQFHPGALSLMEGQTITIVNDDADLLHHAYVESDTFNFDSGDQEPGNRTPIVFTTKGDFKVQCGIHPKMKLLVHVE